jgi:hypothetical protein
VKLSAILQARVIAFFEVVDLSPRNGLFFPEVTKELVQRFNFQKYPQALDDWQNANGAQFTAGKIGPTTVDVMILFNNGIQIDTHAGTTESKRILEETLEWGKQRLGLSYSPDIIKRWAYVSNLTFYSDVPILSTPPLSNLAQRTSSALSEIAGDSIVYEPINQTVGHNTLALKYGRAGFTIQRRLDIPFKDNKYFSEAPLPTEIHQDLLAKFEAEVKASFVTKIRI